MPYPSQVSVESVLDAAAELVDEDGVDALTLGKIAQRLHVSAPSLYRYYRNKEALIRAVNLRTLHDMFEDLYALMGDDAKPPKEQLLDVALSIRQFAHARPHAYLSAMTAQVSVTRPDEDTLVDLILPIQNVVARISGEKQSLAALRGLYAMVHGYCILEIQEQFQRGGDLDEAFVDSVSAYLDGWARQ